MAGRHTKCMCHTSYLGRYCHEQCPVPPNRFEAVYGVPARVSEDAMRRIDAEYAYMWGIALIAASIAVAAAWGFVWFTAWAAQWL